LETFEDIAHTAINRGDSCLKKVIDHLEDLFRGINETLYRDCEVNSNKTTLRENWNDRLGPDGVIEIDGYDSIRKRLMLGSPSDDQLSNARIYPLDISSTDSWKNGKIHPDNFVYLPNLTFEWWGNRLIVRPRTHRFLTIEIVSSGQDIQIVASRVENSDLGFGVFGKLKSIRMLTHKQRLLTGLQELEAKNDLLEGEGAVVPDPFSRLSEIFY